jgi:AcrR family transcriptional regulator
MTKKDIILNTTLKLIAEKGISGSPMSLIVKQSGVSTGTIYHYFKSKEDIINALYINKKKDFKSVLDKYEQQNLKFKEEFRGIWTDIYQYFVDNPLIYLFTQQVNFSPIITEDVRVEGETYYKYIYVFFGKGIQKGKLIPIDLNLMTQMTFGNIISLVDLNYKGIKINKQMLQDAIEYSWRAIKK